MLKTIRVYVVLLPIGKALIVENNKQWILSGGKYKNVSIKQIKLCIIYCGILRNWSYKVRRLIWIVNLFIIVYIS